MSIVECPALPVACRLGYWTYGGPPPQDPFGGTNAAERAACLRFMRLTAAEVLDWLHKQHVPNARERRRRERLQPILEAMGEPHSADELPGIAVYSYLYRAADITGDESAEVLRPRIVHRERVYQVKLMLSPEHADSIERDAVQLCTGRRLRFPPSKRKDQRQDICLFFNSVAEAAQARDEALFAIYGLCATAAFQVLLLPPSLADTASPHCKRAHDSSDKLHVDDVCACFAGGLLAAAHDLELTGPPHAGGRA